MDNLSDIEFLVMGIKEIIPSKFEEIKNRSLNALCKPNGGLWGCPVNSEGQYLSDWIKFCSLNAPDWISRNCVKFKLKEDSNILVINSRDSLLNLLTIYNRVIEIPESLKVLQNAYNDSYIDFESLSKDYDGFYLDFDWFKDFIFSDEDGLRYRYLFSLWDVNSILLFNLDCVKEQTYYELDTNKILSED